MQTMSDYYRYFLQVSSGTTFYKRGIDTKDKIKASQQNNFNYCYGNILQSDNDSKKNLTYLT